MLIDSQKRKLLKLMVLMGLLGSSCARAQSKAANPANQKSERVIIIGAGLAGLAAAHELLAHGREVLILEARNRIGGRIFTSDKWKDMPLDLGASWIHGTQNNPLSRIADDIDAKRIATSYENSIIFDTNGIELTAIGHAQMASIREQIDEIIDQAQKDDDTDILSLIKNSNLSAQLNGPQRNYINFILSSEMEQEYGGSASELSAHYWDSGKEFDGEDVLFAKGFGQICEYLARDINIELGQIVQEVVYNSGDVKIKTQNKTYSADKVIISVPLGVLKSGSISFSPPLPSNKQMAIKNIGMGVLNKCYLRFNKVFWPEDIDWIEYIPKTHGLFSEWVSFKNAANFPVLLGFNAAQTGRELEALTDDEIVEKAMETLTRIFGEKTEKPIDFQITRWASDPFALGSYSFNKSGMRRNDRAALLEPIDARIYFAGEATRADYFGTAHGALISGVDAAKAIMQ